jgi:hypothetical protein
LIYEEGSNRRLNITHTGALQLASFAQYYDQIEDNEMDGTNGMHRRDEKCVSQKSGRRERALWSWIWMVGWFVEIRRALD